MRNERAWSELSGAPGARRPSQDGDGASLVTVGIDVASMSGELVYADGRADGSSRGKHREGQDWIYDYEGLVTARAALGGCKAAFGRQRFRCFGVCATYGAARGPRVLG